MAYYLYHCLDIADREQAATIRRESLAAHLAYVKQHIEHYAVAGPNRDADGAFRSSCFIIQASSLEQADRLMAADPYVVEGLYQPYQGVEFMAVAGEWVGGTRW